MRRRKEAFSLFFIFLFLFLSSFLIAGVSAQPQSECIYFTTFTATIVVTDLDGNLLAAPSLADSPSTTGIEIIGDVLYIASPTLSTVNMYNISDNLKFIDTFITFDEGFYLESISYDPVTNTMYASCDDFPYVIKISMDATPATPALNYTGFLSTPENLLLASAVWYVRVIRNTEVNGLVIPSLSNVIGLKDLDNPNNTLEIIYDNRASVLGPLRWAGIWPLEGMNDTILVAQVRPYEDISMFAITLNGTFLGAVTNSTDGYYDVVQDSSGLLYMSTVNTYRLEKRDMDGNLIENLYESVDAPPLFIRRSKCPVIDPVPPPPSSSDDNTLVIVLSVVLPVVSICLLCVIFCLILLLLVTKIRADRKRKKLLEENEEEMILLAEQYDDGLPESGIEVRERTTTTAISMRESASSGNVPVPSKRLSVQFEKGLLGDGRPTFRSLSDDAADVDVGIKPDTLQFQDLEVKGLFPIRSPRKAQFSITNKRKKPMDFKCFVPKDAARFVAQLWPGEGRIPGGESVVVTVKAELLMTANIFRYIRVDLGGLGTYYTPLCLTGEVSTFLDPDEVETFLPPIGHGAFGTVYRGKYRGSNVAVKIVNDVYQSQSSQSDFNKEVELLTKLRSPYVLNFIGASHVSGKLCILTEYMKGGSLSRVIYSDRGLRYGVLLRLAIDVASAVGYLHENGVIHRDIKPDNFLVVSLSSKAEVTVKVADFGTSKLVQDPMEAFKHTMGLGTPVYMAPELLTGEKNPYSAKVDIYSLGILLWILYHREEPYREFKKVWDIPRAVLVGTRPEFDDECPENYKALVTLCWKQDPDDRPEMDEVVERLRAIYAEAEDRNLLNEKREPGRASHRGRVDSGSTGVKNWRMSQSGGSSSGGGNSSRSASLSDRTSTQHSINSKLMQPDFDSSETETDEDSEKQEKNAKKPEKEKKKRKAKKQEKTKQK